MTIQIKLETIYPLISVNNPTSLYVIIDEQQIRVGYTIGLKGIELESFTLDSMLFKLDRIKQALYSLKMDFDLLESTVSRTFKISSPDEYSIATLDYAIDPDTAVIRFAISDCYQMAVRSFKYQEAIDFIKTFNTAIEDIVKLLKRRTTC